MNNWPTDYHVIVLVFVALAWIIRGIVRFFKWTARQIPSGPMPTNTVPQAVPGGQQPLPASPLSQGPPPAQTLSARASSLIAPRPMPRQPQAGGPAVGREPTERDFRQQEDELAAYEPTALGVALQSSTPTPVPMKKLFGSSDDLVRAIILREALGPPLSRRHSSHAPQRPPSP